MAYEKPAHSPKIRFYLFLAAVCREVSTGSCHFQQRLDASLSVGTIDFMTRKLCAYIAFSGVVVLDH